MNVIELAKAILLIDQTSITKVRFAKTIYFVHKNLILARQAQSRDIKYIRMPLGPVPDGFMTLEKDCRDIIVKKEQNGLLYDAQLFLLDKNASAKISDPERSVISNTLSILNKMPTSEMVALSHKDKSWIERQNGEKYYITDDDLKNIIAAGAADAPSEVSAMQSNLVAGMIDDMVEESTALEH